MYALMESRPAKLRRLFVGSGIGSAKLVKLMSKLRNEEDLAATLNISRQQLNRAVEDLYKQVSVVEKLPRGDGFFQWPCVSLAKV